MAGNDENSSDDFPEMESTSKGNTQDSAESLFISGNSLVISGKYLAAARAFRNSANAGHTEAPQDCSLLIDAMLCGNVVSARRMFQKQANAGNPFAACCNFLSWLNFSDKTASLKEFDLVYAYDALKQAESLKSEHAKQAAAHFFTITANSTKFKGFISAIRRKTNKLLNSDFVKIANENIERLRILGDIYSTGTGVTKNNKKAAKYYSAAKDKCPKCAFRLSLLYLQGEIETENIYGDSWILLSRFCDTDMPENTSSPAEVYLEAGKLILHHYDELGKKQEEAVPYMEYASSKENMEARRILGKMLFYGRLMHQDKEKGLRLIDESFISGNITAALDSGLAYYYHGLLQKESNLKIAMERFTAAAENGIAEGWKMLGRMFLLGENTGRTGRGRRDESHARKCFKEALLLGDMTANYDMAQIFYSRGGSTDFEKAYRLFENLAAAGHAPSQYRAALMLMDGIGTGQDLHKAKKLLLDASSQGHSEAAWKLFEFAVLEMPDEEKPETVLELLLRALELGSISALLFVRNGKKSTHLPVMLKERFFSNFLFYMKELLLSRQDMEKATAFFIFALKNADLLVPVRPVNEKFPTKESDNQKNKILENLGREILGSDKIQCSAAVEKVPKKQLYSFDIIPGMDKSEKQTDCKEALADVFFAFSRIENIPAEWQKKYRFIPMPAKKTIEMFSGFQMRHKFPEGIVLDPCGKALPLHQIMLYFMDNLLPLSRYFIPAPPREQPW